VCAQEERHDKDEWGREDKPVDAPPREGGEEGDEAGGAPAPAPPARPPPAPAASAMDDLLGLTPAPAPAPTDAASVPVTRRVGVMDAEAAGRAWAALVAKPAGVLFEDAPVQIGVKRAFAGAEARLSIFVGNKSATTPYVAFRLRVPDAPGLKVTLGGELPPAVAPKSQARVDVTVEAMAPFLDAPALQVSFISEPGTGHAYGLKLPLAAASFCEGVPMGGPDFKGRWGALAGAPREVTAVVPPASGAPTPAGAALGLAALAMAAVDAGAPGATGASTFRTKALAPSGAPISVGCLGMVIPDAAAGVYKCAVRTQHGDVSRALMNTLQAALAAM